MIRRGKAPAEGENFSGGANGSFQTGGILKKRDILAAAVILLAAFAVWGAGRLFSGDPGKLRITVDGEVYGEYPLDQEREIRIGDTNICRIRDGEVSMTWADCPDQVCVETLAINRDGGTIVCLPNRVVLEITDAGDGLDDQETPEDQEAPGDQELPDTVAS